MDGTFVLCGMTASHRVGPLFPPDTRARSSAVSCYSPGSDDNQLRVNPDSELRVNPDSNKLLEDD